MPEYAHLANVADLEDWADRVEAQTKFPSLLRRVIKGTNDQVAQLDMRDAEGAGFPGYDGRVQASKGTPIVPLGDSVWELGVGGDPREKANADYAKRTKDPLDVDPGNTTPVSRSSFLFQQRLSGNPGR